MRPFSLHAKTAALAVGVALLSGTGTLLLVGTVTLRTLHHELERRGVLIADTATELVVDATIAGDQVAVQGILAGVVDRNSDVVYAFVRGGKGEIVAHTFDEGFPMMLLEPPAALSVENTRYSMNGKSVLETVRPLIEGMAGEIHVGADESRMHELVRRTQLHLGAWFAFLTAVTVVLGVVGSRRTTLPLRRLAASMAAYGRGQVEDFEVPKKGGIEVREVSQAFRQMVHDRDRAAADLQASEMHLRELASGIREVFWLVDWIERRITYVSPAYEVVWGRPAKDLRGRFDSWIDTVHPGDRDQVQEFLVGLLDTGQGNLPEFRIVRPEGEVRWIGARGFSVRNDKEDVIRVGAIFEDITESRRADEERRAAELQLQQVQKLESLGVLAGGIAHDFNNMLTGVLGNSELALASLSSGCPDQAREHVSEVLEVALKATDLSNQLLAYSGKRQFVVDTIDLSALVEDMTDLLHLSVTNKAVVRYSLAKRLPAVEGDATQLRQVVLNLVINAAEALGDSSGYVSVSTGKMQCDRDYLVAAQTANPERAGLYTFIEVSDTGAGMDDAVKSKLFDPFFTTKFTGRGLGLAAVLGIVRAHDGAINLYSELGRGTTFKVLFPAAGEPVGASEEARTDDEHWRGSGLVLVVDDEPMVRSVAKQMLELLGFDVLTAADGRAGVELYRQFADEVNVVLIDATMPRMCGDEAFREMCRAGGDARGILMSGYSDSDTADRFADTGFSAFLQKPLQMRELEKSIRSTVEV